MARYKACLGTATALFAFCAFGQMTGGADAAGIDVTLNHARIVKLSRPADTIIIGNPEIADASVQDHSTVVITGRGFGVTNIVVLDEDGGTIVDEQIFVSRDAVASVRVYRRSDVQTLSCIPFCESAHKTDAEKRSETELNQVQ